MKSGQGRLSHGKGILFRTSLLCIGHDEMGPRGVDSLVDEPARESNRWLATLDAVLRAGGERGLITSASVARYASQKRCPDRPRPL